MARVRVVVVDDHTLVREGLCRMLSQEKDIEVVGQTGSGRDAVTLCEQLEPTVLLLDYRLPDLDGLEVTQELVARKLSTRVVILTMYDNEEYATRLIRAGASGFVAKGASPEELLLAVRKVADRGTYVTPRIMDKMVERMAQPASAHPTDLLSDREVQVLIRLAQGLTTREVAKGLHLSISTIETYRSRILEKLNLRNNSDITRFAIRQGLVELD